MRDEDIPALFEARLNFYEAGRILYSKLLVTTEPSDEQENNLEDARMYASQSSALLMTGPELEAADKTAKGILANAISDEIARRSKLTGHQGLQRPVLERKPAGTASSGSIGSASRSKTGRSSWTDLGAYFCCRPESRFV